MGDFAKTGKRGALPPTPPRRLRFVRVQRRAAPRAAKPPRRERSGAAPPTTPTPHPPGAPSATRGGDGEENPRETWPTRGREIPVPVYTGKSCKKESEALLLPRPCLVPRGEWFSAEIEGGCAKSSINRARPIYVISCKINT